MILWVVFQPMDETVFFKTKKEATEFLKSSYLPEQLKNSCAEDLVPLRYKVPGTKKGVVGFLREEFHHAERRQRKTP